MTEPRPAWFIGDAGHLAESEIQRQVVEALEAAGWEVLVTAQDRATRKQSRGLPDLLCWKHDHTLYVECKKTRGRLSESQCRFAYRITGHEGPHLRYIVIRHPAMIDEWLTVGQGAWREKNNAKQN